ncbi:MAG: hypothetical protein RMI56_06490 [Sulfolobales archaeon]|nr:hypothetical protein [Sulfolobales archaeon]MDW8083422.1 hypothetical protein [Sulfolobales archaeon]
MSESHFYIKVARDFLDQAESVLTSKTLSLAALSLVLAVENSILSVISCFKLPSAVGDPVMELKFIAEEHSAVFGNLAASLDKFIEISQYVEYTYRDILMHGDYANNRVPSEILSIEEFYELKTDVEKTIEIASALIDRCQKHAV